MAKWGHLKYVSLDYAQKPNRITNVEFRLLSPFCQTDVLVAQLKYTKICIKIGYFVNLNMQGKKNFTPQLFVSVNLLDLVPEDNFTENC